MNTITITGRLIGEPEIRYTREGVAQTRLQLPVPEVEGAVLDIVASGDLAENIALSLSKDCAVIVTGRVSARTWQDDDEQTCSAIEVLATTVATSLTVATVDVNPVRHLQETATS